MTSSVRLRHAVTLAEHGSFRRAATALRISQPALTKSIQALEAELGVALFERRADGVLPTEFGKLVVQHARDALHMDAELRRRLALLAGRETGSTSVAVGPLPNALSAYPAAAALLTKHPNLRISMQSLAWRDVTQAVVDTRVDLGIGELSAAVLDDTLHTELVGQHRAYFVCRAGHPVLRERELQMVDLFRYPWVTTRLPQRHAAAFERDTGRAGSLDPISGEFVPAIDIGVPSHLGQMIAATELLALCPLSLAEAELTSGAVVVIPFPKLELRAKYGFIHLASRPLAPATLAFMEEFRRFEGALVGREAALAARFAR